MDTLPTPEDGTVDDLNADSDSRANRQVTLLSTSLQLRGPIFDVVAETVQLPSGLKQELLVVEHSGAACVAPVDSEGRLLLVKQYRHAARDWLIEIPAGRLEAGEDPLEAAQRELEEETGFRATRWSPGRPILPAPGFCTEILHLFFARDLEEVPGGGLPADADEELELLRMTPREILAGGAVRDAKTLVAAALLLSTDV